MSDYISRADAMEAVQKKLKDWGGYAFEDYRRGLYEAQEILEELPSADAEPTVIRAKTFMRKEDFDKWAADNDFQKDEDFCSWGERREESEDEE